MEAAADGRLRWRGGERGGGVTEPSRFRFWFVEPGDIIVRGWEEDVSLSMALRGRPEDVLQQLPGLKLSASRMFREIQSMESTIRCCQCMKIETKVEGCLVFQGLLYEET